MKRLILEQSNDEFYTSHSDLALIGACINRYSDLGRQVSRLAGSSAQIAEFDILRSYLGLLCLGKSDLRAGAWRSNCARAASTARRASWC